MFDVYGDTALEAIYTVLDQENYQIGFQSKEGLPQGLAVSLFLLPFSPELIGTPPWTRSFSVLPACSPWSLFYFIPFNLD
jgi:hypothetical protein